MVGFIYGKNYKGLEYFNKKFPYQELEEAIRRKGEITPILLDALDKLVEHPEIATENSDYMLHIYALHLLAQFKEKKAFPKIISSISLDPDDLDEILDDTITEGLASILYSTFDGQLSLLQSTIENPKINIYARCAALNTYAELYSDKALSKETVISYLKKLIYDEQYNDGSDLATHIQDVVIEKHLFEMIDDIQYLYDEDRIDIGINGKHDDFIDSIFSYEYSQERVKYIDDTIAEMEWWACFEQTQKKHIQREMDVDEISNQMLKKEKGSPTLVEIKNMKVGRNNPCPCGSGKKYKHCCLNKI
ncbi:MAG TPA: DUF1186 domain-containing protein [Clostridiales bacterium]|nr:DUF1186 domain-containing protein [Clostridiales bacterium]